MQATLLVCSQFFTPQLPITQEAVLPTLFKQKFFIDTLFDVHIGFLFSLF